MSPEEVRLMPETTTKKDSLGPSATGENSASSEEFTDETQDRGGSENSQQSSFTSIEDDIGNDTQKNFHETQKCPKYSSNTSKLSIDHTYPQLPPIELISRPIDQVQKFDCVPTKFNYFPGTKNITNIEKYSTKLPLKQTSHFSNRKLKISINNDANSNNKFPKKQLENVSNHLNSIRNPPPALIGRQAHSLGFENSHLRNPLELGFQEENPFEPSRRNELNELWNCANGSQKSDYQGRKFCLKITDFCKNVPMYVLSSSTQAFYSFKYIVNQASTQLKMMRYDPEKNASISISDFSKFDKGVEVVCTTLEPGMRQVPQKDGLVALLYPKMASKKFIKIATKVSLHDNCDLAVSKLEEESGRLVWDGDSGNYYLIHPVMRVPFRISISSKSDSPVITYRLENAELLRDIVTVIRDGVGTGFVEIDSTSAAKLACSNIIDVAVCATMLVALITEEHMGLNVKLNLSPLPERRRHFQSVSHGNSRSNSNYSNSISGKKDRKPDLESQDYSWSEESIESLKMSQAMGNWEKIFKVVTQVLRTLLRSFNRKKMTRDSKKTGKIHRC